MELPTSQWETGLYKQGFKLIAGLDEAGRGSWAGPVVAGAVILKPGTRLPDLRDSKLLDAKRREKLYALIAENAVAWAAGISGVEEIDAVGVGLANRRAMDRAVASLKIRPEFLLIDAVKLDSAGLPYEAIIHGDAKVRSIAAASIIAKVTRDRLMIELAKIHPGYGFEEHKGYGTAMHQQKIKELGASVAHRKSFLPINLTRQGQLV